MILSVDQIALACDGRVLKGSGRVTGVAIDSRKVRPGDLFVPIKGEKVDGHDFFNAAVGNGAVAVLWGRSEPPPGMTDVAIIQVNSAELALQELASWYLGQMKANVVAVTGSVGKTSTKDFIASVLRTKYKVLATKGNYNTEIGLPLNLFELTPEVDYAVLEMGMRGPGQIKRLTEIAQPTVGVITNVGETHIELLGSREAIAQAKGELMEAIPSTGWGIINGDDPLATKQSTRCIGRVGFYGVDCANQSACLASASRLYQLADGRMQFVLSLGQDQAEVTLVAPGRHNVQNALAAAAVGSCLGLTTTEIVAGLESAQVTGMRCEVISTKQGFTVINDTYNACFDSMRAGLELLASLTKSGSRSIAVLGNMLELGAFTDEAHRRVGEALVKLKIDLVLTVGDFAREIANGALMSGMEPGHIISVASTDQAAGIIRTIPRVGDVVLVKGSRGMQMEQIVEALTGESNNGH